MKIIHLINSDIFIGNNKKFLNFSMKKYIIFTINNLNIFDLKKIIISVLLLKKYIKFIYKKKMKILFIGTKNFFRELIYKFSRSIRQPFVCNKWISGSLTNLQNYKKMINKLKIIRKKIKFKSYTKKEKISFLKKEKKIEILFGGFRNLKKTPKLIIISDINKDKIIVNEAKRLKIKIASFLDSSDNCSKIDFILPCNNNSINSIKIILNILFKNLC
ncbi:ribosomal protein S2 [Candidatus Carsonella ruddii PV]|uniref:Small ribosomal subunit protein uS2 n=1 Tax=Carsonella ruddii (strain PV) TaxID=387662 RepID=RS2_CARRP|nr:30S ribosomal protein S2 [Candidatus Carsonella ruddii]Q05FX0.1 RecName: Full=Small ribosomal subunit protein uS2; AltName: Full=30S ribosomal protein S2 [Candidatus Carsonella ruddii PV]BAF35051.1 ribosomal protein S2 [Candidatus Carsonella ruddii PV]